MLSEKEKFTLDYYHSKDSKTEEISIDLDEETLKELHRICAEKEISIDDFFTLSVANKLIEFQIEENSDKFENIIDVFDLYNIEEYIEAGLVYLIVEPTGKNLVLLPVKEYEELSSAINERN